MVDRDGRRRLAELLRRLLAGHISADQFETALSPTSQDRAVTEVSRSACYAYGDLWEGRLGRDDQVTADFRRHVARWILFLESDLEYDWPLPSLGARIVSAVARAIPLGRMRERERKIITYAGPTLWPFRSQGDCDRAAENHE